ncbi:MAG: hypothetical protein ABL907_06470 [Hyphomicrobium sp.]
MKRTVIAATLGIFSLVAFGVARAHAEDCKDETRVTITGSIDQDYSKNFSGYPVTSAPCYVDFVGERQSESCKKGAKFTATGIVYLDGFVGTLTLLAESITCTP